MRDRIVSEIKRLAQLNGGQPPGAAIFKRETGIREAVWRGVYWARWGDALLEAGFAPNEYQAKFEPTYVFLKFIEAARHFGHLPTFAELRMYRASHSDFPNETTIHKHAGSKDQLLINLRRWLEDKPEHQDIVEMLGPETEQLEAPDAGTIKEGLVYLIKSGAHYKIGNTYDYERRSKELRLAQPEPIAWVHSIRTDDPPGIEAYWHNRFKDRRANGEWFRLTHADIQAFKRRKTQ
ncbi:GIY-YIG nuclease family protein [Reyranella sp.]|uniref:GIY-YIG nuclease family protein n=1 Tax=Reyranella sp. TaxID=1929291 RepID=UPI00378301D4